jgi:hypothetical protein
LPNIPANNEEKIRAEGDREEAERILKDMELNPSKYPETVKLDKKM